MLARFAPVSRNALVKRASAAARPVSSPEPGGELLGSPQVAPQHRQGLARNAAQARILPHLRLTLVEPERFPLIFDLVGNELPIEIRSRQRNEPAQIGR